LVLSVEVKVLHEILKRRRALIHYYPPSSNDLVGDGSGIQLDWSCRIFVTTEEIVDVAGESCHNNDLFSIFGLHNVRCAAAVKVVEDLEVFLTPKLVMDPELQLEDVDAVVPRLSLSSSACGITMQVLPSFMTPWPV
jgi:hypothetical protein